MISKHLHMTACPALLKGDDQPEDMPLRPQNPNIPNPKETFESTHIYDRLNQEAEIFKHNSQLLKEYYQSEEMKGCSFAPQTLNDGQEKRSLYQFLFDQQNHLLKVEQKVESIKQSDIERDNAHSYHPVTNNYNFINRDETIPAYERLYNLNKQKMPDLFNTQESKDLNDYTPQIQEKSKNMVRGQKVEDILYQDALRRKQKAKDTKEQQTKVITVNVKYTSNNSERIVAQKFIREFETVIDWIFDQTGQERPSNVSYSIDYLKLGEILLRLGFINQLQVKQEQSNERAVEFENLRLSEERALLCEIWSILRGDELGGVSKRNLCLFLLTLIGITDFKIKELPSSQQDVCPDYTKSIQPQQHKITTAHTPNDKPKLGKLDKDGNIIFTFEETRKIQKAFDIMYRNKLGSEELKKSNWKDENPYKPQINETSKAMASQYRERVLEETANLIDNQVIKVSIPENGQITHADLLVLQKKTQEFQLEQKKQQHILKEMEKCPFKPQLYQQPDERRSANYQSKHIQLYQLAKPQIGKRDRTKEEIEYERQVDDCTFQPGLVNKGSQQLRNDQYVNRDVDKTIIRMRQARQRRDEVKSMLSRGYQSQQSQTSKQSVSRSSSQSQLKSSLSQRQKSIESSHNVNTQQSQNYHVEEQIVMNDDISSNNPSQNQDDRIPLLFVDVNLAPNKTERIVVYEGDYSSELAARFAMEHNLDEFMQEKLKELLDYQISGLLTKIDEEDGVTSETDN